MLCLLPRIKKRATLEASPPQISPPTPNPQAVMPLYVGNCLCKKTTVAVKLETLPQYQIICHCADCRRANGSAFSTNVLVPLTHVSIEGPTKDYESPAESGNTVHRIFCTNCGGNIAHRSAFVGDNIIIQSGNFPEFSKVPIGMELYVKSRWPSMQPLTGAIQCEAMPPPEFS